MDIKVGEYVRTVKGTIAKIKDEEFDLCISIPDGRVLYKKWVNDFLGSYIAREEVKSHNFNINELLEEGDILEYTVNNLTAPKVTRIRKYKEARTFKEYLGVEGYKLEQIKIIRVLTKEQFQSVSYEV